MPPRRPFNGHDRRLVVAFDLGTTYSGASYAFLDPGKVPHVQTVYRYPGLESKDAVIPTIIYYDQKGRVLSIGVEPEPCDDLEEEDILKVEWFKLLLRDKGSSTAPGIPSPKLPASKTLVDVYADYYAYLYQCTKTYIRETQVGNMSKLLLDSLEDRIDFVLSHPNGWGGAQQEAMRSAIVSAGIVTEEEARERVTFVTEGEASLHFCVSHETYADRFKAGDSLLIIDAGGGTVDFSSYSITSISPTKISEIAASDCIFEGAVIVRQRAENYFRDKLRESRFGEESYVQCMANEFDKIAKKRFRQGTRHSGVKFSSRSLDTDSKVGIRNGSLMLTEQEMFSFFDPGLDAIIDAIESQRIAAVSQATIMTCFLVGGYAGSEYLFHRLDAHLKKLGVQLCRPATPSNKAVAEGAVDFFVDHFVSTRVARYTYGTGTSSASWSFPDPAAYEGRSTYIGDDGEVWVRGTFLPILFKDEQVSEVEEFRESFSMFRSRDSWEKDDCSMDVMAYRGSKPPKFVDQDKDAFAKLCTVTASLAGIPQEFKQGKLGLYSVSQLYMVLSFGLTEFKAEIAWEDERGVEKRSPASIIYESDFAVTVAS
ncbi:unnamed protein product [Peniophora sp. CBMAI 1063]|nr:unnamed protein product [Peniophora sp. CBMAI 1063]